MLFLTFLAFADPGVEVGVQTGVIEVERPRGVNRNVGRVAVDYSRADDTLTCRNERDVPITWSVELAYGTDVRMDLLVGPKPVTPQPGFKVLLQPGTSASVRFLDPRGRRLPPTEGKRPYSYHYSWTLGNHRAVHDPEAHYRLPWEDGNHRVSQTWGGSFSHRSEYAVDIAMPIGTPVVAARGGRVIQINDGWPEGGPDPAYADQANGVWILHEDGTYGQYVHLQAGQMAVDLGDTVQAGQRLGRSGNSGYSTNPHLHFVVKSAKDAWTTTTHPIRFDVDGRALMLTSGVHYPVDPR